VNLLDPKIIPELLAEAGVGKPKQNSKSYILACPRCSKKDKLFIRKRDGRFVCWVCKERDNFQGAPEYALAEITGRSISELRALLYGSETISGEVSLALDLTDFYDDSQEEVTSRYVPEVVPSPDFRDLDNDYSAPGVAYLASRGIPLEIAKEYGIMYWPAQSRVVFPVISKGKLLGWQSRTIKPSEYIDEEGDLIKIPKALTYHGLAKDQVLMFSDRIVGEHAVLTEGPVDAVKAHLCGGNVASLGKAVSRSQINALRFSGIKKLYLGLDLDASDEIARLVRTFYGEIQLFDMRPPKGLDLGAMSFEEVYKLYKNAVEVSPANIFIDLKEWNEH
jgi:hypothetical protein